MQGCELLSNILYGYNINTAQCDDDFRIGVVNCFQTSFMDII